MFNNKRKRAVVLALIAFFCGATTYVAVDWKRFGGGFLAFFKHKGDPVVASSGGGSSSGAGFPATPGDSRPNPGPALQLAAATSRWHTSGVGGGSDGHKSDDDLFKYGDPAAGGIPPGSFVVAQNDPQTGSGNSGGTGAPASISAPAVPDIAAATSGGETGSGGGVTSPAPPPAGSNGGSGDGGVIVKTPTPPPPPTSGTPPPPPTSSSPPPTQSGTGAQNPGDGSGDGDPTGGGSTPATPTPPVSAVPEASNAAMMGLGALFLAVAATRKRKNGQA